MGAKIRPNRKAESVETGGLPTNCRQVRAAGSEKRPSGLKWCGTVLQQASKTVAGSDLGNPGSLWHALASMRRIADFGPLGPGSFQTRRSRRETLDAPRKRTCPLSILATSVAAKYQELLKPIKGVVKDAHPVIYLAT